MNEEMVQGPNIVYYVALVALLSCITFVMWQVRRARRLPAKVRSEQSRSRVIRFDR